jgi:hypothetical protein
MGIFRIDGLLQKVRQRLWQYLQTTNSTAKKGGNWMEQGCYRSIQSVEKGYD